MPCFANKLTPVRQTTSGLPWSSGRLCRKVLNGGCPRGPSNWTDRIDLTAVRAQKTPLRLATCRSGVLAELLVMDSIRWISFLLSRCESRFHGFRRHCHQYIPILRILRKEVIQPQVPLRLPCYDLVPIVELTFGACLLAVNLATSGPPNFRGLTGGVYKAQEHIHRSMLTYDY